jgi:hypothetical protein
MVVKEFFEAANERTLKHVVLEGVQIRKIRTRLVSHLGQPIPWTSTIHHLL